jgi:hypothetical protein
MGLLGIDQGVQQETTHTVDFKNIVLDAPGGYATVNLLQVDCHRNFHAIIAIVQVEM